MSYPILFSSTETAFLSNGIGVLPDAATCKVTEVRNGSFELAMTYPVTGIHYVDIEKRSIILARPNTADDPQPFRVYKISKPMRGIVTVNARHISYDLAGVPVGPFTAASPADALAGFQTYALTANPFTLSTDIVPESGGFAVDVPSSVRSWLAGKEGSLVDVWGGEWYFDHFNAYLLASRGQNRGVEIRYGKNMIDLQQEENCEEVYTGIAAFWKETKNDVTTVVQTSPVILETETPHDFTHILPLDLTGEFKQKPSVADLTAKADEYLTENPIDIPKVSLEVSFAQLAASTGYEGRAHMEDVRLCDTVSVYFQRLGVAATAKCIEVEYNVLLDRIESIKLGDAKQTLADVIAGQSAAIVGIETSGVPGGSGGGTTSVSVVLIAGNWSGGRQTVAVPGATSDNSVIVGAAPASLAAYQTAGIRAIAQGLNTLTFECVEVPSQNLTAVITIGG